MKIIALFLLCAAFLSTLLLALPESELALESSDVGTHFIGNFKAEALSRIRISSWNARSLEAQSIDIEKRQDAWVLPQHYFYPADAGSTVGELAGSLLALQLGRPLDVGMQAWNDYRLYDPLSDAYEEGRIYGRRVTVWIDSGVQVLDVIIGAEVPGNEGKSYIRIIGDSQVYIASFAKALPTRFSDWVETRLLPIEENTVHYIETQQYRFDEVEHTLKSGQQAQFARSGHDQLWKSPDAPSGQVIDDTAVFRVLRAALQARLYGVKPFEFQNIKKMEEYGIFVNRGIGTAAGRNPLAGNEGVLTIGCNDGLFYYLYLGEVASSDSVDSLALSGGFRYVLLACEYRVQSDEAYTGNNMQQRMLLGQTRAKALNARFTKFVYVIEESDYKLLHPDILKLFKQPEHIPQFTQP